MKALDVRKSMTVVIYDTGNNFFASRAAFMLQSFGHPDVKILDGTFAKWKSEERQVESDDFSLDYDAEFDYNLIAGRFSSYEQVRDARDNGTAKIIDSRPATMVERNGAIPNAINIPAPLFMDENCVLKSDDELRELFTSKGVVENEPLIFSCTYGILSTLGLAVALKTKVSDEVSLFDGSYCEYRDK